VGPLDAGFVLRRDVLASDASDIATADADIGQLVVAHLGQFPDGFAKTAPRVEFLCDDLDRGHLPYPSVVIPGPRAHF
jgi:hypothetical protein